jgi:hypothetical protein
LQRPNLSNYLHILVVVAIVNLDVTLSQVSAVVAVSAIAVGASVVTNLAADVVVAIVAALLLVVRCRRLVRNCNYILIGLAIL